MQRWRRRSLSPAAALDRAVAELEAALRRIGRPATEGLTLQQLERRLGRSPEAAAYLRALRAGRYAPTAAAPTPRGRRALRRELGQRRRARAGACERSGRSRPGVRERAARPPRVRGRFSRRA